MQGQTLVDGVGSNSVSAIVDGIGCPLDDLLRNAQELLTRDSIPSFEESQKITFRLKDIVLHWFESNEKEPSEPIIAKLLEIVTIVARLSKRRVFQSQGKDDEFCLNLVVLDKIKSEISDMLELGKYLPKHDSALLMPFSELISTIIKAYVESIDTRRKAIEVRTDLNVDDLADLKRDFNSSLSIAAFRLRHLSNYLMGFISLQSPFTLTDHSDIDEIISLLKEKGLVPCQSESGSDVFIFVSPSLLEDESCAERFCYSNANTSSELAQDLVVVVPNVYGLKIKPEVKLSADSVLASYALSGNHESITVAAKSVISLRLIAEDLQKIDGLSVCNKLVPLRLSEATTVCFNAIEEITNNLSDLVMQISMALALLQDADRESYARRGLDIETDYMIMTAVSYAFQFLLDAPFVSESLQITFEIHVGRSLHWLGICCRNYINGKDSHFSVVCMTMILEYNNSLFYQGLYTLPACWENIIGELERDFKKLAIVLKSNEDQAARAFIIDQAQTMFRRLGRGCRRRRESSVEHKYPDQRCIESRNMYILSHTMYSRCDIYKCLDLITRKLVVVKKIPKKFISKKVGKLSELDFLKALRNINIVNYLGNFESEVHIFLKMEYCDSQILPKGINMKCEMDARMIGRQVLLGLCYLHANHIIHRDIKPGNILVNGEGFVKIADFGEAQLSGDLKKDRKFDITDLYGTPLYMAPECLHSWHVGTSADIWSFGCVFARLISGQEPWIHAEGKFRVLYQLGSSEDSPFDIDSIECSQECKDVIKSCLQRDPEKRPSAVQLLNIPYFSNLPDSVI